MTISRTRAMAVMLTLGVLLSQWIPLPVFFCFMIFLFILVRLHIKEYRRNFFFCLAIVFALGFIRLYTSNYISSNDISRYLEEARGFEGAIANEPIKKGNYSSCVICVRRVLTNKGSIKCGGKMAATLCDLPFDAKYGDIISCNSVPRAVRKPTNFGEFSYEKYCHRKGIRASVAINKKSNARFVGRMTINPIRAFSYMLRHKISRSVESMHPKEEAALIKSIVLGTYTLLPDNVIDNFQSSGTTHILAASGFNCGIICGVLALFLKYLRIVPRKYRFIPIILGMLIYVYIVGEEESIVRAFVMASLILLARPLGRMPVAMNLFLWAFIILVIKDPYNLWDVGFQLSFLAVYALLSIYPIMKGFYRNFIANLYIPRHLSYLIAFVADAILCTVATMLVTLPVTAYYFNYISLTSVPANILAVFIAPFVLCEGLLCPLVANIGLLNTLVGYVGAFFASALLLVAEFFGASSFSHINIVSPPFVSIVGFYIVVFMVMKYLRRHITDD